MKDFTSKLSLYDILTQLISGFLILALFIPIPENENVTEIYQWIFVIIFSYLIGIIYHRLLEWIRSKGLEIYLLFLLLIILLLGCFCCKEYFCYVIMIVCVIVYLLIFLIVKLQSICFRTIFGRNNEKAIKEAKKKNSNKLNLMLSTIFGRNNEKAIKEAKKKSKADNNNLKKYYKTYYSVMDKPAYTTIMFLEAQEAFLRNLTWIVVAYFLCYYFSLFDEQNLFECIFILEPPSMLSSNCLILLVSLVSFLILILFARYHTQMKVYKAVWEAGKYK
jgi:ABC-type multidrug transport system fused ATPase/permease subunit